MDTTLFYVADPMCSWCWGFKPVRDEVLAALPRNTVVRYVMGGLAPDNSDPMDEPTRSYVRAAWRAVERETGATFNWGFWDRCEPRRSTYLACRAVLLAERIEPGCGPRMFDLIQAAYYAHARNPSDQSTLLDLGEDCGLSRGLLAQGFETGQGQALLDADLQLRRELGVTSFPSLIYQHAGRRTVLTAGYAGAPEVLRRLALAQSPPR